jgi:hypothetical protein
MAINQRLPQSVKESRNLSEAEEQFISNVERENLKTLSLDDLAQRYNQIDRQSQMIKGLILLEARERFPSDKEFGQWISTVQLSDSSRQSRHQYMNFARYFKEKDMTGISITAAYEISAPSNAEIANEIYEYARLKNLPVAEVKKQIAMRKNETLPIPTKTIYKERDSFQGITEQMQDDLKSKIRELIKDTPPYDAIRLLMTIVDEINRKVYNK